MTDEEHVQELILSFVCVPEEARAMGAGFAWIDRPLAKRCALIAIEKIIEALDEISVGESGTTKIDYGQSDWRRKKEIIEKL